MTIQKPRKFTDEHRKKLSSAKKRCKLTEAHKHNISRGMTGRTLSKLQRKRISISLKRRFTKCVD